MLEKMVATSNLSHDGEICVVPAHGRDPGEYVTNSDGWANGAREPWSARLDRLLNDLEQRLQPDVILMDSRAGIDEVASRRGGARYSRSSATGGRNDPGT